MGRKVAFDRGVVLEAALHIFWRDGYDKTCLEDLLKAMGIKLSSFYNSFKSKEDLFFEVLQFYRAGLGSERLRILASDELDTRTTLRKFFKHLVSPKAAGFPPGCFMMKTAVNLREPHSAVGTEVMLSLKKLEGALQGVFERGKSNKEISKKLDSKKAAQILSAGAYGLSVLSRTQKTNKELLNTAYALVDSVVNDVE